MADDPDGDDILFERLQQSASGDAAVRQLRRRYDLLRRDYEILLDRLGEIEDRLSTAGSAAEAEPEQEAQPAPPPPPPQPPVEEGTSVAEGLVGPLLKLRDDYLSAVSGIQSIVSGLDGLAAAAFKGQHVQQQQAATRAAEPASNPGPAETRPPQSEPDVRRIQVDVKGPGFGALLDFQERLAQLAGVSRVAIKAIDHERATLLVELAGQSDQG